MYQNPNLQLSAAELLALSSATAQKVAWRSPSNLAIVKYWGKFGVQQPRNPSISLTLDKAFTETSVEYQPKATPSSNIELDFYFEGQPQPAFKAKIVKFFTGILPIFPFLSQFRLTIHSYNSFPHSAGIASSASSMSALALCLCAMERELFGTLPTQDAFLQKASFVSRLGSGSASRSVYPVAAMWGELAGFDLASNFYAIPFEERVHEVFTTFHDTILIASRGEKAVSSSAGHQLMESNIYAENRYEQARQRCTALADILAAGDVAAFGELAEDEALTLHALMMCSKPSYMLMRPNSLAMIEKVRQFRQDTKLPLYFSLDAGPNLHLLFPHSDHAAIHDFIDGELAPLCENGEYIADQVGQGAKAIHSLSHSTDQ